MTKKKKIILISAVALAFIAGVLIFCGIVFWSPMSEPVYVAHRGASKLLPDNTPLAFTAAANGDFWGIETDVRETSDGVSVCSHDATVKYEDGTELAVNDYTYATLRGKAMLNKKTADKVYLCPFTEYLDICKVGDKVAVIELKEIFDTEQLTRILAEVDLHHSREKSVFIAFDYVNFTRLRALDDSLAFQYLSETKEDPVFEDCLRDGISISVKTTVLTGSLVDSFHEAGLEVNVWTVNTDWTRRKVRRKGVDYITTDVFDKN